MNFDNEWYCQSKAKFQTFCPWISAVLIGPERSSLVWVGLNERNKLFLNEKLISSDCTSFSVHNDFLVISSLDHAANFTPLTQDFDSMLLFRLYEVILLTLF
jgi:elongator complex protein 1